MNDGAPSYISPVSPIGAASSAPFEPGRIGIYALIGGAIRFVPLPWIPDSLTRRVRGALVHDLALRRRVTLSPEARNLLAEPSGAERPRGFGKQALLFLSDSVLKRIGPLGALPPIEGALYTFVLGHLFERYLGSLRKEASPRINVEEARRIRRAIDRALVHALTVQLEPDTASRLDDDGRDAVTAIVDRILSRAAGFPSWLVRRLDAAFDELLPATPV